MLVFAHWHQQVDFFISFLSFFFLSQPMTVMKKLFITDDHNS